MVTVKDSAAYKFIYSAVTFRFDILFDCRSHLLWLTFLLQYVISLCVLALLTRHAPHHIKWIVSAGLSQVSEFSFVLGSRARRLGLISREVRVLVCAGQPRGVWASLRERYKFVFHVRHSCTASGCLLTGLCTCSFWASRR